MSSVSSLEGRGGPLRIALDTTYAGVNRTGVGLYSRRLAAHLRAEAGNQHLDVRCYGPACQDATARSAIRHVAQEWPVNTHGLLPLRMAAFRPDIVHATSHIGPLWGPGRLVVTVHDLIFMRRPEDYNSLWLAITRATLPRVLARASAVIADSYATSHDLRRFLKVPARRLHVVYPGIDPVPALEVASDEMRTMLRSLGIGANGRYVICTGPWVMRKNLRVVLEAFLMVAPQEPDLHLVITGTEAKGMKGPSPSELVQHVAPSMQKRIHCVGFVERRHLYGLLGAAALLAYPSRMEGFGLPPLEAMSLGTPAVVSNVPVLREVTGGAALTAPVDDAGAWAQAFRRVLREPGLAAHLAKSGRIRSSDFSWQRCTLDTVGIYRQVAGVSSRISRTG